MGSTSTRLLQAQISLEPFFWCTSKCEAETAVEFHYATEKRQLNTLNVQLP